jgi:phosphohistidine phosphatase
MKRLLLLRHAKAEQNNKGGDHERELSSRGRKDAPRMGHVMDLKGYVPDVVLCSSSARTRETFELAKNELGGKPEVEYLNTLYLASAQHILGLLRNIPDSARTALAIGHSPGLEEGAVLLARRPRGAAELARLDNLRVKFPTCALAVLDFRISNWSGLAPGSGTLIDFIRPKDLD